MGGFLDGYVGTRRMRNETMTEPEAQNLSDDERVVYKALREDPQDAIAISSRTRLPVDRVVEILHALVERGLAQRREPEPVHERFSPSGPIRPKQPV
jgi:hypothetical protein